MPAQDKFHDAVKKALMKDGWTITHDPLFLQFGGVDVYVDLGAEKIIAAQKGEQKIAVEIKSFVRPSVIYEFYTALGQFISYRIALGTEEPGRILYLAVPSDVYHTFFTLEFTQAAIERNAIKIIIYDARKEVIIQWQG
jgi:hypothetical protein